MTSVSEATKFRDAQPMEPTGRKIQESLHKANKFKKSNRKGGR